MLAVGDRVVFDGTGHQAAALAGTSVRLLSDAGPATVAALPFLLAQRISRSSSGRVLLMRSRASGSAVYGAAG